MGIKIRPLLSVGDTTVVIKCLDISHKNVEKT